MKVDDFVGLKELMLTEQLKKRAPIELLDHFIDSWDEFKEATILAEKLDHFETVGKVHRKQVSIKTNLSLLINSQLKVLIINKVTLLAKVSSLVHQKKDSCKDEVIQENSQLRRERMWEREMQFERKRQIICYYCNKRGHIKLSCPRLRKNSFGTVANLNENS
ncbi:hypothetical protein NPIL_180661 [Nephila pilipes]|uniref:CCHC-type domain-containing protein n=1 Tax=Nephila pilipes TaxID=299642 RepID=A0A8X6N3G4_NEPPI|nr:hypothetical protein NPIL_180661 [Nephila pilipes]